MVNLKRFEPFACHFIPEGRSSVFNIGNECMQVYFRTGKLV